MHLRIEKEETSSDRTGTLFHLYRFQNVFFRPHVQTIQFCLEVILSTEDENDDVF